MMDEKKSDELIELPSGNAAQNLSSQYSGWFPVRALMQVISFYGFSVGSALDVVLLAPGANFQAKRLEQWMQDVTSLLNSLPDQLKAKEITESEEFFDYVLRAMDHVIHTRTKEKRRRFANLVVHQVVKPQCWDEAEAFMRFLAELSDSHIEVLIAALAAPVYSTDDPKRKHGFNHHRVVQITETNPYHRDDLQPLDLRPIFAPMTESQLRMFCAELVGKGLFRDMGIGLPGYLGMTHFAATELATWFVRRISDPDKQGIQSTP